MAVFNNVLAGAAGQAGGAAPAGYEIERSLRFNSADSSYLSFQPSSAGNRKTWTWSGWLKKTGLGTQSFLFASIPSNLDNYVQIYFSTDQLIINTKTSGNTATSTKTAGLFRDPSAWFHVVVVIDTTATGNSGKDRLKIYINGRLLGDSDYQTDGRASIALNSDLRINSTNAHYIGKQGEYSGTYANLYLADVHFIDGQALDPTDFGEFDDNGVWQPIAFTGFGDNPNNGTTWSSNVTGTPLNSTVSQAFDGSLATGAQPDSLLTWTPSSTITAQNQIRLYIYQNGYTSSYGTFEHNGTNLATSIASQLGDGVAGWYTLPSNTITQLEWSRDSGVGSWYLRAVEVDGYVLIDGADDNSFHLDFSDNSTAAALGTDTSGNDNDWTVNNITADFSPSAWDYSQDWSTYLSFTTDGGGFLSGRSPGEVCFDGTRVKNAATATSGTTAYIEVSGLSLTASDTLELTLLTSSPGSLTWQVTGTNLTTTNISTDAEQFVEIPITGAATTFRVSSTTSTGRAHLSAIRINGKELILPSYLNVVKSFVDSLRDSPTNGTQTDTGAGGEVSGNYCTLNPLTLTLGVGSSGTLSNGNLEWSATGNNDNVAGTLAVSSGKFYYEVQPTANADKLVAGWTTTEAATHTDVTALFFYESAGIRSGTKTSAWNTDVTTGLSFANNDILGFAIDIDGGDLKVYQNNVLKSTITLPTDKGGTWIPCLGDSSTTNASAIVNFGQRPFANTNVPTGYKALCTANLDDPTIADGSDYMDVVTYTGNGNTQTISGLEFSPDLLWIKSRSAGYSHRLYDSIRGIADALYPDLTDDEGTSQGTNENLTGFTSDGFSLGATTGINAINANNVTFAGWTWDAGTSNTTYTAGVTPGAGSISSVVRANPSAGFSIVSYTGDGTSGATIGHGLGAVPSMIIVKDRDIGTDGNWAVRHSATGSSYLLLNLTNGANSNTGVWTSTSPTSDVFSIGTSVAVNVNGNDLIAYCFAPVEGYSAFGSYTGNGSTDGPFVYTGFRPAFLMFKRSDSTGDWIIFDNKRNTHEGNYREKVLYPNKSNAEETGANGDPMLFLSNGFKLNNVTFAYWNASGGTYVWAAFAENPLKYARAR